MELETNILRVLLRNCAHYSEAQRITRTRLCLALAIAAAFESMTSGASASAGVTATPTTSRLSTIIEEI